MPNVVLSPNVAGASQEAAARLKDAAVRNLMSLLDGTPVVNAVEG